MNKIVHVVSCISIFVLFRVKDAQLSALEIRPQGPERTVSSSDKNIEFNCTSNEPTTWFWLNLWQSDNSTSTSYNGQYVNCLHMDEVSYKNVGYYYCVRNSSITEEMRVKTTEIGEKEQMLDDLFHQGIAARSYLFVEDGKNSSTLPLVPPFIRGHIDEELIIPCKPAWKQQKIHIKSDFPDDAVLHDLHPRTGYTARLEWSTDYRCKDNTTNAESHISVKIQKRNDTEYPLRPIITMDNGDVDFYGDNVGVMNESITFTCSVDDSRGSTLKFLWSTPNDDVAFYKNRVTINTTDVEMPIANSVLVVDKLNAWDDIGDYQCIVKDHSNRKFPTKFRIDRIMEKDAPIISPEKSGDKAHSDTHRTVAAKQNIEFNCTSSDPIYWIFVENNKAPKNESVLKLDKVSNQHVGYYYCVKQSILLSRFNGNIVHMKDRKTSFEELFYEGLAARVYLFVNDNSKNQIANIVTADVVVIIGIFGSRVNLPCKPSASNFTVQLFQTDDRNTEITEGFDAFTGFRVKVEQAETYYICRSGDSHVLMKIQVPKPDLIMSGGISTIGNNISLNVETISYPEPTIECRFMPCEWIAIDPSSCPDSLQEPEPIIPKLSKELSKDLNQTWLINFLPPSSGSITCSANNTIGKTDITRAVFLKERLDEDLFIINTTSKAIDNEQMSMICGATTHNYTQVIWSYPNRTAIQNSTDLTITSYNTNYTYYTQIEWNPIRLDDSGDYWCLGQKKVNHNEYDDDIWTINVSNHSQPTLDEDQLLDDIEVNLGDPLELKCFFDGLPSPSIRWYKDDKELDRSNFNFTADNTTLQVAKTTNEHEGTYECIGTNRYNNVTGTRNVIVKDESKLFQIIGSTLSALFIIMIAVTIFVCRRNIKDRRKLNQLKLSGLETFEEGYVKGINPALALNEQAELLPYDKRYEFPANKLTLDKQVGAGAFGVVMRATARGILPYEDATVVAVKMAKKLTECEALRSLIIELKIMVHLGQHLNVVNLLGAVTKDIVEHKLMIITEYCEFGNLRCFLQAHRQYFIDQIVRDKDLIDPTISLRQGTGYVAMDNTGDSFSCPNSNYSASSGTNNGMATNNCGIAYTPCSQTNGIQLNTLGKKNAVPSHESIQSRSDYRKHYNQRSVSTSDLLCWSYQVARGMVYLSSRNVLHGDLAARNVLLCSNNVVKICDFGLARAMYETRVYSKKGGTPLPMKWLAPESMADHKFSTMSDVWSFGILMWELFALGTTPYPGLEYDVHFFLRIKDGYRMEKPDYATQTIYDIMKSCWYYEPLLRPSFASLVSSISKMLEPDVVQRFIALNEPYIESNMSQFTKGQMDYLAILGSADGSASTMQTVTAQIEMVEMNTSNGSSQPQSYMSMQPVPSCPSLDDEHDSTHGNTLSPSTNRIEHKLRLRCNLAQIAEEIRDRNASKSVESD